MVTSFILLLKIVVAAYMAFKLIFVALLGAFSAGFARWIRWLRRERLRSIDRPVTTPSSAPLDRTREDEKQEGAKAAGCSCDLRSVCAGGRNDPFSLRGIGVHRRADDRDF